MAGVTGRISAKAATLFVVLITGSSIPPPYEGGVRGWLGIPPPSLVLIQAGGIVHKPISSNDE